MAEVETFIGSMVLWAGIAWMMLVLLGLGGLAVADVYWRLIRSAVAMEDLRTVRRLREAGQWHNLRAANKRPWSDKA